MAIDPDLGPHELTPWLRREVLIQGHSDKEIARLVKSGDWIRVRHGAYIGGAFWRTLSPEDQHRVRARAVLKTANPSAVLSHLSAAIEMGAPTYDVDLTEVHVTRQDGSPRRREAGVVHHTGSLPDDQIHQLHEVRLTTGSRAALEVGTICHLSSALVTVNGLLHLGHADDAEIRRLADRAKRWPGSVRLPLLLRLADGRYASAGESRTRHLCWRCGLPTPQPQFAVRDRGGHLIGICDLAWPEHGLFVEFDGREKYTKYLRDGQDPTGVMLAQQRREEAIIRATGWVCLRLTWADLDRPRTTAARIRAMLRGTSNAA